jgi:D-serine dehydratase
MPLDLSWLLQAPLPPGTKGLPPTARSLTLAEVGKQGWSLLDGDVTLPAAALRTGVVESNAAALQAFLSERGALLAPHGKTTMAPQLFKRQLEAGAWGITVATVTQAGLCHAIGIPRVLIPPSLRKPRCSGRRSYSNSASPAGDAACGRSRQRSSSHGKSAR